MMRRFCILLLMLLAAAGCTRHKSIHSEADLPGARIGILTASAHRAALEANYPGATLMSYEDLPSMCLALRGRKIDALFCLGAGLDALLAGNPGFEELPVRTLRDSVAVAFPLSGGALRDSLDAFLELIREDGRLAEMDENWFGPEATRTFYHGHTRNGKPLRVGIEVGQSGLTVMEGGEETGFEPELMRRFGDHLGRPVHFVEMTGAGMVPALLSGRVDALIDAITPTPRRETSVIFSRPYYRDELHLVVLAAGPGKRRVHQPLWSSMRENLFEDGHALLILKGLWYTLVIMLCSVLLGSLLGALLCWMKLYGPPGCKRFAHFYGEFIEGIPIVVLLLFMFYVVFAATTVAAVIVAIITYSLHFAAGACECFVNGLESVPHGQYEAGQALGFSEWETFRYVALPQAARQILLLFKGKCVSLIENTSIVGFIAIQDLTKVTDIIRTQTYNSLIPLVVVGLLYFLLAKLIGFGVDKLGDYLLKK